MSLALTGAGASPSKVINTALEIWRDDVNAKSGLLGRPVELVIYDDQSSPANVPNIYTKLITVDKVDLLLGPYGTNFVAPAMPTIINNQKMTITFTAIGINDKYHYPKYFSMVSTGPEGVNSFSIGFFDMAAAQQPKPRTVAIIAADAEFAQSVAREHSLPPLKPRDDPKFGKGREDCKGALGLVCRPCSSLARTGVID